MKFPPPPARIYRNHHLDSTRWQHVAARPDDIVVTTAYKAGTTWMQAIVAALLFQGRAKPGPVWQISPWVDFRPMPIEDLIAELDGQSHRRFMKSHLPLDGLPFRDDTRYVYVGRSGLDVFMSLWNHYSRYSEQAVERVNSGPGFEGPRFPSCPGDIHEVFGSWLTRGSFEWEADGYPYWSLFHHVRTWWEYRDLPNVCWVHFDDLLAHPREEAARVAEFLGIAVADADWPSIVEETDFESMRSRGTEYVPRGGESFKGGAGGFLYRGSNGRWRDVLTAAELEAYDEHVRAVLPDDCRRWLDRSR